MTAAEPDLVDRLAEAITEVLGRPIRPDENFFEAGLDSKKLVAVHAEVTKDLTRPVPVTLLFARPNLQALRRHLAGGRQGPAAERGTTAMPADQLREISMARRRLRARGFGGGEHHE